MWRENSSWILICIINKKRKTNKTQKANATETKPCEKQTSQQMGWAVVDGVWEPSDLSDKKTSAVGWIWPKYTGWQRKSHFREFKHWFSNGHRKRPKDKNMNIQHGSIFKIHRMKIYPSIDPMQERFCCKLYVIF